MIDDHKCNSMYDEIDKALELITKKYNPNYFELIHVLYMFDTKIKQANIDQYMIETVEKYSKWIEDQRKKTLPKDV